MIDMVKVGSTYSNAKGMQRTVTGFRDSLARTVDKLEVNGAEGVYVGYTQTNARGVVQARECWITTFVSWAKQEVL